MRDWFTVQTHARAEFAAQKNLERQGYTTYLPLIRKTRKHARKIDLVAVPLFPRYIFVCLNPEVDGLSRVRYSKGVANIVSFGLKPAVISQKNLQSLWDKEDEDGFINFRKSEKFMPGDQVSIINGIFAKSSGIIEKISGNDRVLLLLDLLDQQLRLNTSRESISLPI